MELSDAAFMAQPSGGLTPGITRALLPWVMRGCVIGRRVHAVVRLRTIGETFTRHIHDLNLPRGYDIQDRPLYQPPDLRVVIHLGVRRLE